MEIYINGEWLELEPLAFTLDGTDHELGPDCWCAEGQCECGGTIHFQGIYGGYIRVCDRCDFNDLEMKVHDLSDTTQNHSQRA